MKNSQTNHISFYYNSNLRSSTPTDESIIAAKDILYALSSVSTKDIICELSKKTETEVFSASTIPQFSSLDDCFESVNKLIRSGLDGVSFARMGYFLRTNHRKKGADCKYGENHSKCAGLMGLCRIQNGVWRNPYSYAYESLDDATKIIIRPKLCLGIGLIRGFFVNGQSEQYIQSAMSCLSESTQLRRKSNIKTLIETVKQDLV